MSDDSQATTSSSNATAPAAAAPAMVDPKLLELLVCPLTKTILRYDREANELVSEKARLAFPIRDGIPIMLVDEARQLDDASA